MKRKKLHGAKKKIAPKVNKLLMTSLAEYFFSDFLSTATRRWLCVKVAAATSTATAMTLALSRLAYLSLFFYDDEVTRHIPGKFATRPTSLSLALRGHRPLIVMCFNVSIEFDFFFAFSNCQKVTPAARNGAPQDRVHAYFEIMIICSSYHAHCLDIFFFCAEVTFIFDSYSSLHFVTLG